MNQNRGVGLNARVNKELDHMIKLNEQMSVRNRNAKSAEKSGSRTGSKNVKTKVNISTIDHETMK